MNALFIIASNSYSEMSEIVVHCSACYGAAAAARGQCSYTVVNKVSIRVPVWYRRRRQRQLSEHAEAHTSLFIINMG